jgi:UDP-glucuronate decarboxylase
MKRILITGGAGFIGSHLCEKLLNEGNEIICVDNFFTGQKRNIVHMMANPSFELLRHDITFPLYIVVDEIYNLACPASPIQYQFNPVQTVKTIVNGSINMLGLARRTGSKILQASTSEIYGDPEIHPQIESYWGNVNPIGPRACYDEGKRCSETLFMSYYYQNEVEVKIARIFNTFGPRMHPDDGRVISNFIIQALLGKDVTINGDGSQTRSFCYIDDLLEGLVKLMDTPFEFPGPVNLGNPVEISIKEIAELIKELTGSSSQLVFNKLPEDDPKRRCPDITLAREKLNWLPSVSLEEGLKKTIKYFEDVTQTPTSSLILKNRKIH